MADGGGIQSVQVNPRSDYGGGHIALTKRKKSSSGGAGSGSGTAGASSDDPGEPGSMKRGGKVRKGGMIKMHKGEVVIPAGKAKRMKMKKRGRGKSR
jgi:hypothetical protein